MNDEKVVVYSIGDGSNHSIEHLGQNELLETMKNIVLEDDDGKSLKELSSVSFALKHLRSQISPNILFSNSVYCNIQKEADNLDQEDATLYATYNPNNAEGILYLVYLNQDKVNLKRVYEKTLPKVDNVKFVSIFSTLTLIWIVIIHEMEAILKCTVYYGEKKTMYTDNWNTWRINDIDLKNVSYMNIVDVIDKTHTVTLLIQYDNIINLATLTSKQNTSPRTVSSIGNPIQNLLSLTPGSKLVASIFNKQNGIYICLIYEKYDSEKKTFTYSKCILTKKDKKKEKIIRDIIESGNRIRHWKIINNDQFIYITDEGNIYLGTISGIKLNLLHTVPNYNTHSYYTAELIKEKKTKKNVLAICHDFLNKENNFQYFVLSYEN